MNGHDQTQTLKQQFKDQGYSYDVIIVGSGAAGLSTALSLDPSHRILILTKSDAMEGSTRYAQGGIAAVWDKTEDTVEAHIDDTLKAGAHLNQLEAVQTTVMDAEAAVSWLIEMGVPFTKDREDSEKFHLTREGGHSKRRILHVDDATGFAVQRTLLTQVQQQSNITVLSHMQVFDVEHRENASYQVTAYSAENQHIHILNAKVLVFATGGASALYAHTTNTPLSMGEGIALSWRLGCQVANLEFNQFHPTMLYHPASGKNLLLTEALRGEGAYLVHANGERFMPRYHEALELAPRDVVSRAIFFEMQRLQVPCVFLDISHRGSDFIRKSFPNLYQTLMTLQMDMTLEKIPVVPAAHYTCGGVVTDLNGQTTVPGIYAVGETACTGLHGANRMASNSLLECIVFAKRAATHISTMLEVGWAGRPTPRKTHHNDVTSVTNMDLKKVKDEQIQNLLTRIQTLLWEKVGIVRTKAGLLEAKAALYELKLEVNHLAEEPPVIHLKNILLTATLMVQCALERKGSLGIHFNVDELESESNPNNTVLSPELFSNEENSATIAEF